MRSCDYLMLMMSLKEIETCIKDEHYWDSNHFNCMSVQFATCIHSYTSLSMARVLITGILALLLLQLATGQSTACQNALNTLGANTARCAPTAENPQLYCTGECRGYYDAVIDNCDENVS